MAYTLCMSHNFIFKLNQIFFFIIFAACSNYKDDSIGFPNLDAGNEEADMSEACYLQNNSSVSCIMCPEWCNTDDTDACDPVTEGCICSFEGRPCGEMEECRIGHCWPQDPNGEVCEFDERCPTGKVCIEGLCSPSGCRPELCNGYDDDCDGYIDNSGPGPMARWCSDRNTPADLTTELTLPCQRGSQICAAGIWQECIGSILPVPEIGVLACDRVDNNCDGCIDGDLTSDGCNTIEVSGYDIVFAIDISGSMGDYIAAVRDALNIFVTTTLPPTGSRFSLIVFPTVADSDWRVVSDFEDLSSFQSRLALVTADGGSNEATYDLIYALFTESISLSWRPGAIRIIVVLGDEYAQTYSTPPLTESTVCGASRSGEVLAVVTNAAFFNSYDQCADTFQISYDQTYMANNLSAIITDPCN